MNFYLWFFCINNDNGITTMCAKSTVFCGQF